MTELIFKIEKEFLANTKIANKNMISQKRKEVVAGNCWDKEIEK